MFSFKKCVCNREHCPTSVPAVVAQGVWVRGGLGRRSGREKQLLLLGQRMKFTFDEENQKGKCNLDLVPR